MDSPSFNGITFSNFRAGDTIQNWPLGSNKRGPCVFAREIHPKRGMRISRTTTGAPKFTTYSPAICIADGSDGRTYILSFDDFYGCIFVMKSDLKSTAFNVWQRDCSHAWLREQVLSVV